jgi:hypothetical protein
MDKLEKYQNIIKKILTEYYEMTNNQTRDQYIWFRFGWEDKKQIQHIIIYLTIKNGKIWVEEDATDLCIVDDLLSAGIPQNDIVLGFHHPSKRVFTEFATA